MMELIQITNDPALARRCAALGSTRLMVDLERLGKAQRQAGRNTFISTHTLADVARVRTAAPQLPLMVRLNPLHPGTASEVDAVLEAGADLLMLPMFDDAQTLAAFARLVRGRLPIVPLLETAGALRTLDDWVGTPGLHEIFVGLNDLHVSLGQHFMFEPLAAGLVDEVARAARAHGLRFGFGGIAQIDGGLLPGHDVLAEHLRLGSGAVILSRTFASSEQGLEEGVAALRRAEAVLAGRSPEQVEADRVRIARRIHSIASDARARPAA